MKHCYLLLALLPAFCSVGEDFALFRNGKAAAFIETSPAVEKAVALFNSEAKKCTDAVLPTAPDASLNRITFKVEKKPLMDEDAYSIDFPDARTMRITCSPRSASYALWQILEDAFGVRWLFPHYPRLYPGEVNEYPRKKDVGIPRRTIVQGPSSFRFERFVDWRLANWWWNVPWGAKRNIYGSHSITLDVFPLYKYAVNQSWPKEILPLQLNGKRYLPPKPKKPLTGDPMTDRKLYYNGWNPCFSHPRSAAIAVENILEILKKNPDRHEIALMVNDNSGMCFCGSCAAGVGKINGKFRRNSIGYHQFSEVYWKWVNTIAEQVSPKYPDVWFTTVAYRDVQDPPSFKLHPRVVVKYCFELTQVADPKVRDSYMKKMTEWSEKCSHLIVRDYVYGMNAYLIPRVYFRFHSDLLKKLKSRFPQVVGFVGESLEILPFNGPKTKVTLAVLRDVRTDPDKVVMDWCVDCVGPKAAPYLKEYYRFWEEYWTGPDIRKTTWHTSCGSIYMQLFERSSHLFALRHGDMKRCRDLMEKTVALADTPSRKRRAQILMELFEFSESAVKGLLAEHIHPEGALHSAKEAAALLKDVPSAWKHIQKMQNSRYKAYWSDLNTLPANLLSNIALILKFRDDANVRKELTQLSENQDLPLMFRGAFQIWQGNSATNLIENGSFEDPKITGTGWAGTGIRGVRMKGRASDGNWCLAHRRLDVEFKVPVQAGKTYLFMADACTNKTSGEGRFGFNLSPYRNGKAVIHYKNTGVVLPGSMKYQTLCGVAFCPGDMLRINLYAKNYEADEKVYLDNVRLYCLEDICTVK